MLTKLNALGLSLVEAFGGCYDWFVSEQTIGNFYDVLPFEFTGLAGFILEKINLFGSVTFVPADLFFNMGLPLLLGLVMVKWVLDAFM